MLYKDKEVHIHPYYEKEIEVYKVFYTKSGRDEDGIYGSYNEVEEFPSKEKAEKLVDFLREGSLSCSFNYSYSDIYMQGPYKITRNVYLPMEDKIQCMIQFLTEIGYKVTKDKSV